MLQIPQYLEIANIHGEEATLPAYPHEPDSYSNPLIDHDIPDPDAIRLDDGSFALVASSFDRRPGLPLWRSHDLVTWTPVGFAGGFRAGAPADGGVWAPSIRSHEGTLFVVWGDPDVGIFVTDAAALEGPWSPPRLLLAGQGLIDACPIWEEDGTARIVHGYARSRAGFANRVDAFAVDAGLTRALGASTVVIDGDAVEGCTVLEGPKAYRRDGWLWIFAPAGGVETGWQYAFRARSWDGPWEHRIVLEQGASPTNGPHQGAWVEGNAGEEWFVHFQHKGHLGRVLHLQPLGWGVDGWPRIGQAVTGGPPEPVDAWPLPAGAGAPQREFGDDFARASLSPAWFGRDAEPGGLVTAIGGGRVSLRDGGAIVRPLDGVVEAVEVEVVATDDAEAALVWSDARTRELRVRLAVAGAAGYVRLVVDGDVLEEWGLEAPGPVRIGSRIDGASVVFTIEGVDAGEPFTLVGRRWTGAEWGLAARGAGTATFGRVVAHAVG